MAHEPQHSATMTYEEGGERFAIGLKLPYTQQDWHDKRRSTDAVLEEVKGIVTRVGDETVGEMWSLFDGRDVLNEVDPRFDANIERYINTVLKNDPFHVSANTADPSDRVYGPSKISAAAS